MYVGLALFVLIVVGGVSYLIRVPFLTFVKAIREPFLIAFTTASSEAALPKALEVMERFGVPKNIVGFVLPTGYSFNLDGTTLYLSLASVFVAQLAGVPMTFGQQLVMMLTLMLTSKGVAGVPRAALVVLDGDAHAVRPAARRRRHPARHRPDHGHGPHGRERDGQLHRHRRRRALGRRLRRRADAGVRGGHAGRLMRIVVVGARGQLGAAVVARVRGRATTWWRSTAPRSTSPTIAPSRRRWRASRRTSSSTARRYNDVDGAETHPVEALNVNAFAVRALARAAAAHGATLVHYSTDFVFDGTATAPYTEDDRRQSRGACTPRRSSLGEWFAADAPRAYVLRVESLFGRAPGGRTPKGSVGGDRARRCWPAARRGCSRTARCRRPT